jgi:hypothetical protein
MKTKAYLTMSCVLISFILSAKPIDEAQARRAAINFFYERVSQYRPVLYTLVEVSDVTEESEDGIPLYYLCDIMGGGWVIVTAHDGLHPVPAYSLRGSCTGGQRPPAFSAWMEQYRREILHAVKHGLAPTPDIMAEWERLLATETNNLHPLTQEKEVLPLLVSSWDQSPFYNDMCPADPQGPGGHCVTGCVATAMGQLAYYFRWPETGTGSYTYVHPDYGTISADFGNTTYRWDEMENSLSGPNPAVAEILFHLGVSVDMDYGPDGSGMWNHKAAYSLRTYFKYAPETEYLFRDSTSLNWDSTIVWHLERGIPMYYAGWDVPNVSGHAFICDGYQAGGYFHFNWGWSGSYDGYFYLEELNPGGSNFNLAQELIIHCYPDTAAYQYPPFCTGPDTLTSMEGSIDDGSGPVVNYPDNAFCSWLIDPQTTQDSVTSITMTFHRFDTEEGKDMLTVYDGPDDTYPVLGTFSGGMLPPEMTSTGNRLFMTFVTDGGNTAPGWFLTYKSTRPVWCQGLVTFTAPTHAFGDGSGTFFYRNNSACLWMIQPQWAASVTLYFTDFNTEADEDVVKIFDAATSTLLATYSGDYSSGSLPDPVTSPSGKMFVAFSSNQAVTAPGWEAYYTVSNVGTKETPYNGISVVLSPNPADGISKLSLSLMEAQDVSLSLRDVNGKEVLSRKLGRAENFCEYVDLRPYAPGVYVACIRGDTFCRTLKVLRK